MSICKDLGKSNLNVIVETIRAVQAETEKERDLQG